MPAHFSIQGHRGARGHFPENTLRSFIAAIDLGADTIELDVVISGDKQVVVSHEAWMNEEICSLPDGGPLPTGTGKKYNLYRMPYEQIKQFDCGKRGHNGFPLQHPESSFKPLLSKVFDEVETYCKKKNIGPVGYNIELKSEDGDGLFNPGPEEFADLVYGEIFRYKMGQRINVQSFDVRLLREMRKRDPAIRIGLLVENNGSLKVNLESLGFSPGTYSPDFALVNAQLVEDVHELGIKIVPWTVNEKSDMLRLISMGVDGIISDYPDRVAQLIKKV